VIITIAAGAAAGPGHGPAAAGRAGYRLRRDRAERGRRGADTRAVWGSAFGLLATVQAGGNLIASAVAGLLWSAASPQAAFVFLAAAMVIAAALIITAGPGSAGRPGDTRRKTRPFRAS